MKSLYQTLETLALTLPRFDCINHAATAIVVVYRDEIELTPLGASTVGRLARLSNDEMRKFIVMVIRDLQEWGRRVLIENSLGEADNIHGRHEAFKPDHAQLIQNKWDSLSTASVWSAFERQFALLRGH